MNSLSYITQDNHAGYLNTSGGLDNILDAREYVEPIALDWFNNNPSEEFYSICVISFELSALSTPSSTLFAFQITRSISCTVY